MHVISRKKLKLFWLAHADAESALRSWFQAADKALWRRPADVQEVFGRKVDQYEQFTIFDVGGNKYRLIAFIDYERQKIFVRQVLTHAEYDRGRWKDDSFSKKSKR